MIAMTLAGVTIRPGIRACIKMHYVQEAEREARLILVWLYIVRSVIFRSWRPT